MIGEVDGGFVAIDDILLSSTGCFNAFCDFNEGSCSYHNDLQSAGESKRIPWLIGHGRTFNSSLIMGPKYDHTDGHGMYAYVDFTHPDLVENDTAILRSEIFPPSEKSCLIFWSFISGPNIAPFFVFKVREKSRRLCWPFFNMIMHF